MEKIKIQNEYIKWLNDLNLKHSYYNKNKFIFAYASHMHYFYGDNFENVTKQVKKYLWGFKPVTSTII